MSRLLADTHAVLWALDEKERLSTIARDAMSDPANLVFVSSATLWEIAIKRSVGKLDAPEGLSAAIDDAGFAWLPVTPEHAWAVRDLPLHHRDPFDRLLVAQAQTEGLTIVSADPRFAPYGVDVCW